MQVAAAIRRKNSTELHRNPFLGNVLRGDAKPPLILEVIPLYIVFVYLIPIFLGVLLGSVKVSATLNTIILISYGFLLGIGFGYVYRKR